MELIRKIKLLAVPAIIINLMLTGMATAQADSTRRYELTNSLGDACIDLRHNAGVLSGSCQVPGEEYRQTSIDLNEYIANHDGVLVWSGEGNFADTSDNCSISPARESAVLICLARTIDGRDVMSPPLYLGDHIAYVDGQLQYINDLQYY